MNVFRQKRATVDIHQHNFERMQELIPPKPLPMHVLLSRLREADPDMMPSFIRQVAALGEPRHVRYLELMLNR
ncbi:MAG: hypothetical protein HY917_03190, partial [Candidatus Diapherotrites archaeon]|nr:hypothetical protein [Candidatus Diapherotrites archaeon]